MTQTTINVEDLPPDVTLHRLIDSHGTRATLRALATVLWHRRTQRADAGELPDHLRRDIGLPERGDDTPRLRGPWL